MAQVLTALSVLGAAVQVWGWSKFLASTNEPSAEVNFRSWRVNLLSVLVNIGTQVAALVVTYIYNGGNVAALGLTGGGLGITGVGAYFIYEYVRLYWYNYDPYGDMASEPFNWFASDEDSGGVLNILDGFSESTDNAIDNGINNWTV